MRLIRYTNINAYAARALPFLLAREAEHCLPIGLITLLQRGEARFPYPPYLALVEEEQGEVIAAPMATPPHNLILSHLAPGAESFADIVLSLIAEDSHNAYTDPPGVFGPDALASHFAGLWVGLTEQSAHIDMRERIYRLERVQPPRPVGGAARRIVEADRPLLREWLRAFFREAMNTDNHPQVEVDIDRRLRFESSGMYLWQDEGQIVSLAGYGGPTPHGARIGPVYTPPEARGHGYASALVADLSQRLLDEGRQFVFLFTNLANPTANHIYQEIGYQPVSDVAVYAFQPKPQILSLDGRIVTRDDGVNE